MSIAVIVHALIRYVNPKCRELGSRTGKHHWPGFLFGGPASSRFTLTCHGLRTMLSDKNAIIHGTGLMGASIGLGLTANGWTVSGWDPEPAAAATALGRGAISSVLTDPFEGLDRADLLVLAGPPRATLETLESLDTDVLVTDITSVKTPIVGVGRGLSRFVPGHPMAGSASSGAEHASAHLFHGASWVLCDDLANTADIEEVKTIVRALGANPVVMSASSHDERVALVSHLPRLLASILIQMTSDNPGASELSAGSFRDLTRVAGSDANWWTDVFLANRDAMDRVIGQVQELLGQRRHDITAGDSAAVNEHLSTTAEARAKLGAPVAAVRVILFDKPGEIGLVGRSLEKSGVDLRDLQLRHAEYGGGGVLTLSVGVEEAGRLRDALTEHGFELEE